MTVDVALAVAGVAFVVIGLLATVLRRMLLSSVLVAVVAGVVLGPELIGILDPAATAGDERKLLEEASRVTLSISLVSAGLQVRRADLRENRRAAIGLLTVAMLGMWLLTGLGAWLLLGLPVWGALLVGAILAPTDPVVASTLVNGRMAEANVPRRLRATLLIESGANDGLALPFVLLAAFMLTRPARVALEDWLVEASLGVGVGIAVGLLAGVVVGRLSERALHRSEIERSSLLGLGLGLALACLGGTHLLGGSGVLASFAAGLAFSFVLERHVREELEQVQETVTRFLILPVFILFGALLPWSAWGDLGGLGLAFAAWALLMRRLPVVPLALAPAQLRRRDVAWLAWFGPMGIAAVYYALFIERYDVPAGERISAAALLVVLASIVVHSLSATPGVRWLAGRRLGTVLRNPLGPGVEERP